MKNPFEKLFTPEMKEKGKEVINEIDNVVIEEERAEASTEKLPTNIQVVSGIFTIDDFKELSKMAFNEDKEVMEIILVKDCQQPNPVMDMVKSEISIVYPETNTVYYFMRVVQESVTNIEVIVSGEPDKKLNELLSQNNNIIRIKK